MKVVFFNAERERESERERHREEKVNVIQKTEDVKPYTKDEG